MNIKEIIMDFRHAKELLAICQEKNMKISEVMHQREIILGESSAHEIDSRMARAYEIMKASAHDPIASPGRSMGGLIGGEAKMLMEHSNAGKNICGDILQLVHGDHALDLIQLQFILG